MISIKDWMECINYRITEGSEFGWRCYGPSAHALDSWDGEHDGVSASIVFDTETQVVYEASVYDYSLERAYRLINPEYRDAYNEEAKSLGDMADTAWDGVKFIDLESDEDFLDKCWAIMNYEKYDDRIAVPLDLPEEDVFKLMKLAHERDITFNQLVEEALKEALDNFEKDPEAFRQHAEEFLRGKSLA